jgi:hypothetical protein
MPNLKYRQMKAWQKMLNYLTVIIKIKETHFHLISLHSGALDGAWKKDTKYQYKDGLLKKP